MQARACVRARSEGQMWARHAQPVSTTSPPTSCRSSACRASRTFAFARSERLAVAFGRAQLATERNAAGAEMESDRSKPRPGPAPVPYHFLRLGPTQPRVDHHLQVGHGRHVSLPSEPSVAPAEAHLRRRIRGTKLAQRPIVHFPDLPALSVQMNYSEWLDRGVSTRQISVPRRRRLREWRAIRCQYLW